MKRLSNYRLGFEPWGLTLFALVMLPNLYWFAVPAPCLSFLCFAADRKNGVAAVPLLIFTVCHILYGVLNFLL